MNKNTELKKETISLLNLILEESNFNDFNYKKWKRNNVTYRGIKDFSKKNNENYGSFGEGLYTAHLSNKKLAKEYGKVYYVVNAIPKNPKVVNTLNDAELFRQKLIDSFCKSKNVEYSRNFFDEHTSMDKEMLKQGYDGLIIKGREIVNYYPPKDVEYFETEEDLYRHYLLTTK